jgi:autotransporter-associated beta strand protein
VYSSLDLNGYGAAMNNLAGNGLVTNSAAGAVTLTVGSTNPAPGTFDGTIADGPGKVALTKISNNTLTLTAGSTFSGPVTVAGGTLALTGGASISNTAAYVLASGATVDVSALSDPTLYLNSGQSLAGTGTVNGNVTLNPGAAIGPGTPVATGALAVSGSLNLNPGASCLMKLNKSALTNDSISGMTTVAFGGALTVTNLAGTLASGDTFTLFNAMNYTGAFAGVTLPPLAAGLNWNTNNLAGGVISVAGTLVAQPVITGIFASGPNLVFSGTGGPAGSNYSVVTTSNLTVKLTNWTLLATNQFGAGGNFSFTNIISPAKPQLFFRLRVP